MSKTLVIARHAKSDWSLGLSDHERPLNSRGQSDTIRMGQALKNIDFEPDLFISSTAVRAKTTAEAIAREINFHQPIRLMPEIYEEGHGQIVSIIQNLSDDLNSVALFGHNPTLELLAAYLLQMQSQIVIPTSGMICLETIGNSWKDAQPGKFQLKWFLIPKTLD